MTNPIRETPAAQPRPKPTAAPRWSREQIRAARHALLSPVLARRGIQVVERSAGNLEVRDFPGLIVKESYWRWPESNLSGNAIDFLVKILRLSFADAMEGIAQSRPGQPRQ